MPLNCCCRCYCRCLACLNLRFTAFTRGIIMMGKSTAAKTTREEERVSLSRRSILVRLPLSFSLSLSPEFYSFIHIILILVSLTGTFSTSSFLSPLTYSPLHLLHLHMLMLIVSLWAISCMLTREIRHTGKREKKGDLLTQFVFVFLLSLSLSLSLFFLFFLPASAFAVFPFPFLLSLLKHTHRNRVCVCCAMCAHIQRHTNP